jgi:phosphatidylinositol kinase/protein kinase (PI-3  family)
MSLIDEQKTNGKFNDVTSGVNPGLKAKFVDIHGALAQIARGEYKGTTNAFAECRIDVPSLTVLSGGGLSLEEAEGNLESMAYITGCDSEVDAIESSRHPTRLTLRDSKGARRPFMLKKEIPREDNGVEREQQMMELVRLMNRLFAKDRRKVRLAEFVIIMVGNNCGLYEWLDGTSTLAKLVEIPAERTVPLLTDPEFCERWQTKKLTENDRETLWRDYPAVLHEFFVCRFPRPQMWSEALIKYKASTAAWSALGWLMQLDDRHLENILIVEHTGEVVHVDVSLDRKSVV